MEAFYVLVVFAYLGIGSLIHTEWGNDWDNGFSTTILIVMWPIVIGLGILLLGVAMPLYVAAQAKNNGWFRRWEPTKERGE